MPTKTKDWLAVHNLVTPKRGLHVIEGEILDRQTASRWIPVKDADIPHRTIIRSGSRFRGEIGAERERVWAKELKAVVPLTETRHFIRDYMDKGFGDELEYAYAGEAKTQPLAKILADHNIYTLEQVAENAEGSIPFSERIDGKGNWSRATPIHVLDLLKSYYSEEVARRLMVTAFQIVQDTNNDDTQFISMLTDAKATSISP